MSLFHLLAASVHRFPLAVDRQPGELWKKNTVRSLSPLFGVIALLGTVTARANGEGFITTPTYPTGANPRVVAVGDFNGDGIPDLAVANQGSNTVSVLLGNGDGTFQPAQNYTVGSDPVCVAVGDFNGDGSIDLAVANYGDFFGQGTGVSILLGNDDGTFQPAQTYAEGLICSSVAVADFNSDGTLDLAVANPFGSGDTVSILMGNGDGSFQAPQSYAVNSNPVSVAVGDFNRDGIIDLVVANAGTVPKPGSTVSILLGNGDGTFQAAQDYDAGPNPSSVAVGDFNGDGIPDLAVADGGVALQPGGTASVLLGNGDGTFQAAQGYAVPSGAHMVAVGDLNGDGFADLAVAEDSGVSLLLGNGDGTFQSPQSYYAAGPYPYAVAIADFNGDAHRDLAVTNFNPNSPDGTLSIFLGNGNGTFQAAQSYAFGNPQPVTVAVGDLNNDGIPDLAVASNDPIALESSLTILRGNGDGTFQTMQSYATDYAPIAVMVADLNGDSILDVAVVCAGMAPSYSGTVDVFLGNGDGTFQAAQSYAAGFNPASATVADVNGDGIPDLIVADQGGQLQPPSSVSILLGNGDGTFQAAQSYTVGSRIRSVVAADFNHDGIPDLVVANSAAGTVSILLGNGDGTFQAAQDFAVGASPVALAVGDLNGDGILDLAVANLLDSTVSVLLGNGDGTFQAAQTFAVSSSAQAVAVGDFNHDGILDLAVATPLGMNILLGNGDGSFQGPQSYAAGSDPISIAVGDFNGDGFPDLAVANMHNYPNGTVTVLLNAAH
jgi:hypothetical protein